MWAAVPIGYHAKRADSWVLDLGFPARSRLNALHGTKEELRGYRSDDFLEQQALETREVGTVGVADWREEEESGLVRWRDLG